MNDSNNNNNNAREGGGGLGGVVTFDPSHKTGKKQRCSLK